MLGKIVFWLIVLLNLGGAAFGFFVYYPDQLVVTNPLLWILVVDCPLAALLFAIAFFFRGKARPEMLKSWLGDMPDLSVVWFVAFVGALKYGFWTMFVLVVYSGYYFSPGNWVLYMGLFVGHLFLMFETMLLVGKIKVKDWFIGAGLAWFFLNDMSDYFLGTHPPLPETALGFMFPATVAMSVLFTVVGYVVLMRWSENF